MKNTRKHGFTLIELLVGATIIGVLVAIGVVSYASVNKRSRDTKRRSDIEQLRSALEMYRADIGYYPNNGGGGWTDANYLTNVLVPTYMPVVPSDPKAHMYEYRATDPSAGLYYGYCLTTFLEADDPTDTCSPDTSNVPSGTNPFGVKSP